MLAIRIEIQKIDYEKCVRSLLERFQAKIQESPDAGKVMLISELANQ